MLYYPFVDGDGGLQATTNTLTNRYDGDGCHIMLVSQGIGIATTGQTTIVYVDSDGNTVTVSDIQTKHDVPAGTLLTAADALSRGFDIVVPDPCIAARDAATHDAALRILREQWPAAWAEGRPVEPSRPRAVLPP